MKKWIWLDMDGTLNRFYEVEGWLEDLIAYRTRPYEVAENIYGITEIIPVLAELKNKGYNIGVISWGSKACDANFDKAVEKVKIAWLKKYLFDVVLDKVIITAYGVRKADTCRRFGEGILVDDEAQNRDAWDLGATIDATQNIITELKALL